MGSEIPKVAYSIPARLYGRWRMSADADGDHQLSVEEYLAAPLKGLQVVDESIMRGLQSNKRQCTNVLSFVGEVAKTNRERSLGLMNTLLVTSSASCRKRIRTVLKQRDQSVRENKLLDDNRGRIELLLVSDEATFLIPQLAQLRPDMRFAVLVVDLDYEPIRELRENPALHGRLDLIPSNSIVPHKWPQDAFEVATDDHGKRVIMSAVLPEQERPGRGFSFFQMGRVVAEYYDWRMVYTPFDIDGGNLIGTGGSIFVGSTEMANHSSGILRRQLSSFYGGVPMFVRQSSGELRDGHIDLFFRKLPIIHPTSGKPVVLVGDLSMAVEVLRGIPQKRLETYITAEYQKKRRGIKPPPYIMKAFTRIYSWKSLPETERKQQIMLDSLAEEMRREGYHVIRMPYYAPAREWGEPVPHLSYANALFETDESKGDPSPSAYRVILPRYGIPELDGAAMTMLQILGYHVDVVDGLTFETFESASLRCLTKALKRTTISPRTY